MIAVAALALWAFRAVAETDPIATEWLRDIQKGKNNNRQIETLRVLNDAVIGGAVVVEPGTPITLANAQTVTLSRAVNTYSADVTLTNTLAAPTTSFAQMWVHTTGAGSVLLTNSPTLVIPAGLTNVVTAAYSGIQMTSGDVLQVLSVSNKWRATLFINQ
jgi:hypothetical protein